MQSDCTPPWGRWEVLLDEPDYKVKRITVNPGHRLSYQKHFKRKEHWFLVQGEAVVTLNERKVSLKAGEHMEPQALIMFVGERLAGYKKPQYVEFISDFPCLEDGSPDRSKIKELYGGSQEI